MKTHIVRNSNILKKKALLQDFTINRMDLGAVRAFSGHMISTNKHLLKLTNLIKICKYEMQHTNTGKSIPDPATGLIRDPHSYPKIPLFHLKPAKRCQIQKSFGILHAMVSSQYTPQKSYRRHLSRKAHLESCASRQDPPIQNTSG